VFTVMVCILASGRFCGTGTVAASVDRR